MTTVNGTEEPPRRSERRNVLIAAGAAVGVLALLAGAVLGYSALNKKMDATRKLDQATTLVEEADAILVDMDEVVSSEINVSLADEAADAGNRVDTAEDKLREANDLLGQAKPSLGEEDRIRADRLEASADARLEMLEVAPLLLSLNEQAARAMPVARDGWTLLLDAESLSRQAVAAYNKLTKAGVTESQRLNKQAGTRLVAARERFAAAESAFPAAAFENYVAYVDKRIEINATSQATDTAWLAGDINKANTLIKQYNTEDPKAVVQFKELPNSTDAAIGAAYDRESADAADAYYEARDRALKADDKLE